MEIKIAVTDLKQNDNVVERDGYLLKVVKTTERGNYVFVTFKPEMTPVFTVKVQNTKLVSVLR